MKTTYSIGLIALMVFAFSQPIFAQAYGGGYQSLINTFITNKIWELTSTGSKKKKKKTGNSGDSRSSDTFPTTEIIPPQVPAYRAFPAVQFKSTGTRLKLQELADAFGGTPEDKAETKGQLEKILDEYDAEAAAKGYPNDLALAIVSYMTLNGYVYKQETAKLTIPFGQNLGLRDVLAEGLARDGAFDKLSDRQKQEMYESLVMMSGITYQLYQEAKTKKNAEDIKNSKVVAARNLKDIGIKP